MREWATLGGPLSGDRLATGWRPAREHASRPRGARPRSTHRMGRWTSQDGGPATTVDQPGGSGRGAGWDEGEVGGRAGFDETPESIGVQVFLDQVAEQVE